MKKKNLLLGFMALSLGAITATGEPYDMQVWLKNGDQKSFDVSQVDSVTFGTSQQPGYDHLTMNTLPPTFEQPNPLVVSAQEQELIRTNNEFATKCYSIVRQMPDPKNPDSMRAVHFYSPISLGFALGLCANGATDKGAQEIADALGFKSLSEMNDFYQKLYLSINSNVDSVDIRTANALWINEGTRAYEDFVETSKEKYYATVRHLDFTHNPSGATDTINHWAALMTNNRIKKLSIEISEITRLIINNACYFKAKWKHPFTSYYNTMTFNGAYGKTNRTDAMYIDYCYMECASTDLYQAVKLDYADKKADWEDTTGTSPYSMIVVLPTVGHDLDEVLPTIKWDSLPLKYQTCEIVMPKFESKDSYSLAGALNELNIQDIFSSYPKAIYGDAVISQVTQDYFLKVDEIGTEAAVVTSIGVDTGWALTPELKMLCDRPFAFVIRENSTGLILFMGEYDFVPQKIE